MTARSPRAAARAYQLLDIGDGRQLDRFGRYVLDRPSPAALLGPRDAAAWEAADARYERSGPGRGRWHVLGDRPIEPWELTLDDLTFELRLADSGQVGLFPEQAPNWTWIRRCIRDLSGAHEHPRVLNLFAYTGGSTLAAAIDGAAVVHVDAARSAIAWARRNAELSGLAEAPIRWIAEDAETFARRELRRGNRYNGVILDPPSYGHGPRGEAWKLEERLPGLLALCTALTAGPRAFVLLTAHTPPFGPERLGQCLADGLAAHGHAAQRIETGPLELEAASGRRLRLGAFARWRA